MHFGSTLLGRSANFSQQLLRQFRFPPLLQGLVEALLFALVFLAAGRVSLGFEVAEMMEPMVPVVLLMMLCMVCSGVYRREVAHSIVNIYCHSVYGFILATMSLLVFCGWLAPAYANAKFIFFFLFFGFFVINSMRPLISGTDFMDGGGRRIN